MTSPLKTAPPISDLDRRLMAAAIRLGRSALGRTWPNPAVGTLLVQFDDDGCPIVVGSGVTGEGGRPHAEEIAIDAAGDRAKGATAYVSLEPCAHRSRPTVAPCSNRLIEAGVARVLAAIEDPNPHIDGRGFDRLRDHGVEALDNILQDLGEDVHAGHFRRMKDGRPHVALKLAVSRDGKIGRPGASPVQITGEAARRRVHTMRAEFDAILVGVGTVLADDPMLDCRLPGLADRSPVRVVFDTYARTPPESAIAKTAFRLPTWLVTAEYVDPAKLEALVGSRIERLISPITIGAREDRINAKSALQILGERGITRLMVEGGSKLAASLIAANLVDELVLFHAPIILGSDGIPALDHMDLDVVTHQRFRRVSHQKFGEDLMVRYLRR